MQQSERDIRLHALAQAQLADRCLHEVAHIQQIAEQIEVLPEQGRFDLVDFAIQLEAVQHRQVPEQAAALAEDDPDVTGVLLAVLVRAHAPDQHLA